MHPPFTIVIVASLIENFVIFEEHRDDLTADQAEASPPLLRNHYDTTVHNLKADNVVPMKCES
eukprot:scaffold996_cov271-Chaetoceros_neogracile.AAC.13